MQFTLSALELPVRIRPERPLSDEELLVFCAENDLLRIEREPNGELTVMSPSGSGTGGRNAQLTYQLVRWAEEDGRGMGFDSSAGFRLPDGSMRSPDASWISWGLWNALSAAERESFAPICPEFVIELRSPSDRLPELQAKMYAWLRNGAELGWLIDPERRVIEVYRRGAEIADVLQGATTVFGEEPVGGFVLDLARIWQ